MEEKELNLYRHYEENVIFAPAVPQQLPITIVTGFLGAGKTTILRKLAEQRAGLNIAMCVHEAAPHLNVDSHLLSGEKALRRPDGPLPTFQEASYDGWVVPLDGCGCCISYEKSIKSSLSTLIERGLDAGLVDYVLIETSGAEDPQLILQLVNQRFGPLYRARLTSVVCVIDATAVPSSSESAKRQIFERQLACADLVIVNKADLIGDCEDLLRWLAPTRVIVAQPMGHVDIARVLQVEVLCGDVGLSHEQNTTLRVCAEAHRRAPTLLPEQGAWPTVETREWGGVSVDPRVFLAFCRDVVYPLMPRRIWRAKGVFTCGEKRWEWNVSGTRRTTFTIAPWASKPFSKIALIGVDLPTSPFDALLSQSEMLDMGCQSAHDHSLGTSDIWEERDGLFRLTGARRFGYRNEVEMLEKIKVDIDAMQESFELKFNLHRDSQGVCALLLGGLMFAFHPDDATIIDTIANACLQETFAHVTSCICGQ